MTYMDIKMRLLVEQEMTESGSLSASEMADNICSQVGQLDASRRYMFMSWLFIHSRGIHRARELRESLTAWLGSMPAESAAWEYKLIMGETRWWRDLDEPNLTRMMLECLGNNL